MAIKEANLEVDTSTVTGLVNKIKAKDSSPTTVALVLQIVSTLNLSKAALKPYMDDVHSVLDQADELDGNMLFFEKGLYTTSLVAKGISDLINAYGGTDELPENKIIKLINFIYARLRSTNLRAAAHLISAFRALATNPHLAPIVIKSDRLIADGGGVHYGQPKLKLKLVSLWGDAVYGPDTMTLKAGGLFAVQQLTKVLTLVGPTERGAFTAESGTSFQLSLSQLDGKDVNKLPVPGHYVLELSAQWTNTDANRQKQLLGVKGVQLPLRVLTEAEVVDPVLIVMDVVSDRQVADIKLNPGQRYTTSTADGAIDLDLGHQMVLTLRLVDKHDRKVPLTAHQMFLQLTHLKTQQAITYLFTEIAALGVENAKAYQFRLEPEHSAADFDYLGGVYKMELIMGDTLLIKPVIWHMADVNLHFTGEPGSDTARRLAEMNDVSRQRTPTVAAMKRSAGPSSLIGSGPTKAKPEIEHMFRAPERRAPSPIAWAFTIACVVPLLGLLVAWTILGVNVWNFRFRLSNILFHAGLIAIFALYFIYWCYLDMFTTLGYLVVLGIPTFLTGNCVLRAQIAARHAASTASAESKKK
ncbi:hypothetical protein EG68_07566 [Paragonimus skrjabini miyazakii]|uniref:Dolichyl-diphosphooligosaccharide--protein glycosyltransferase subunit 2 n=1 Tax=Paragonimus skrjabini miyazakii TaxID=59628 RepID=A0A8S9YRL7_9TREM|nr:hypothetical protein EG68_07566 [Paragonimus skrjabini miyazakii]